MIGEKRVSGKFTPPKRRRLSAGAETPLVTKTEGRFERSCRGGQGR
jgi:hypothetical protein